MCENWWQYNFVCCFCIISEYWNIVYASKITNATIKFGCQEKAECKIWKQEIIESTFVIAERRYWIRTWFLFSCFIFYRHQHWPLFINNTCWWKSIWSLYCFLSSLFQVFRTLRKQVWRLTPYIGLLQHRILVLR